MHPTALVVMFFFLVASLLLRIVQESRGLRNGEPERSLNSNAKQRPQEESAGGRARGRTSGRR